MELTCPECEGELDELDTIVHKKTRETFCLYICHNEDCLNYGTIYNDRTGDIKVGDPSGCY